MNKTWSFFEGAKGGKLLSCRTPSFDPLKLEEWIFLILRQRFSKAQESLEIETDSAQPKKLNLS